jgi:alkanesulfonate monooxygenase SsuD/methylene tetrahydromethanopterin reductase-like flavin-dependent oxidoreductase (luciferase family)
MTTYGYTLMSEQSGPRELVGHAVAAEEAGFDFEVMSDHYFPWLEEMGHSPYAWSVLGAVSQVTERVELMTYVTCPLMRYHPAVVAQKAATVDLLSNGRFTLGLGAGESLNEHVIGQGWPPANVRHEMLAEALAIIGSLFDGGYVNFTGAHYRVDSAKVWDLPQNPVPIAVAVSGEQSVATFAPLRRPPDRGGSGRRAGARLGRRAGGPRQLAQDRAASGVLGSRPGREHRARPRAVPLVRRWVEGERRAAGTGRLRGSLAVRDQGRRRRLDPVRTRPRRIVKAVRRFEDAGFTDVALVQIGDESQREFLATAERELLPALRG